MRPRIEPLVRADADPRVESLYRRMDRMGNPPPNMHLTFGRNPDLYEAWLPFALYVMPSSSLPARDRQILILRSAYCWRSGYVWAQHEAITRRLGALSAQEIADLGEDDCGEWAEHERALIRACDETRVDGRVSDACWAVLDEHYGEVSLLDVLFTIGQYGLIATCLNSLHVPLDSGLELPRWAR